MEIFVKEIVFFKITRSLAFREISSIMQSVQMEGRRQEEKRGDRLLHSRRTDGQSVGSLTAENDLRETVLVLDWDPDLQQGFRRQDIHSLVPPSPNTTDTPSPHTTHTPSPRTTHSSTHHSLLLQLHLPLTLSPQTHHPPSMHHSLPPFHH